MRFNGFLTSLISQLYMHCDLILHKEFACFLLRQGISSNCCAMKENTLPLTWVLTQVGFNEMY